MVVLFIVVKVRRPSRLGESVARSCSSSCKHKPHSSMEIARAALSGGRIAFKGNLPWHNLSWRRTLAIPTW
jgi:hypothetical protein